MTRAEVAVVAARWRLNRRGVNKGWGGMRGWLSAWLKDVCSRRGD